MGQMYNELLENVGSISEEGLIFDTSHHCIAKITDTGYISSLGTFNSYGKIDEDGTIRNSAGSVIGRIQADGYVYIHSNRVGKISSSFVEKITPKAWNAGHPSTFAGRDTSPSPSRTDSTDSTFFTSKHFIFLIIGIALGIFGIAQGWGFFSLLAGPILVYLLYFIYKIFNG